MPWPSLSCSAIFGAALALSPLAATAQGAPLATEEAPPAVVGWLAQPSGTVWIAPGAGQAWQPAAANQPVQSGEILATAPDGRAMIEVMSMRAVLAPSSELAIDQLGSGGLSATETSGEVALDLTDLPPGAEVAIATPRGTVEIASPGRYEIAAGAENQPTVVTALGGPANIVNGAAVRTIAPGQTASLFTEPNGTITASLSQAAPDPLLSSLIASAPPRPQIAPPPEVAEMTGGASLAAYGTWADVPEYGTIWYPNVAAGWAPYRDGQWSYVPPWGWTWVDADPWGFAPFHYGRWVEVGPRWGWVPVAPGLTVSVGIPVYAPALVHFFGGVGVSISAGAFAAGLVGWVPLGPGEFYRPPYRVSPTYIRQVNVYNVRNINRINITEITNRHVTINNFVNRRAITTVPASVLADGRPVRAAFHRPPEQTVASLRPLPDGVPVRPGPDKVWAKPQHVAAVHPPAAPREPERIHPATLRPAAPAPQHPARPEVQRPAAVHPPEPPHAAEPNHPATLHPVAPAPQHPARPEVQRPAAVHPPEPPHAAEPNHPATIRPPEPPHAQPPRAEPNRAPEPNHSAAIHAPAPPPARPPAETSRPAYHPAPPPPREAQPERPPPRPAPVRPPEPPQRAEAPHPMPAHAAPRPEAPPSHGHEQRPPDQDQLHH